MNTRWVWEEEPRESNSVQEFYKNSLDYFKWCGQNPIKPKRTVIAGKEVGKKVEIEKIRPYSLKELCIFCGVTEEYVRDMLSAPKDSEAYLCVGRIILNIQVQLTTLALVGEISPILASKILSLDTKDDGPQKVVIEHVGDLPALSSSEIQILENIDLENGELKILKDKNAKDKNMGEDEDSGLVG